MGYWKHFGLVFSEVWFLFWMMCASIIHAILPWVFDFDLLKIREDRLEKLRKKIG
jgi:hypothetical protein